LASISVDQGGLFSSPISQIETDKGIYRVEGDIGHVKKGIGVYNTTNFLYFESGNNKVFRLKC